MIATDQIKLLDSIKKYIEENEMSFLIGAGFSRNVNNEAYPLWGELLKEAAVKLFVNGRASAKQKEEIIEKAIKEYGYLGIASMMVKKAGFHEAIDTYIEERTPYLKTDAGKPELFLNGVPQHKEVNPTCHSLLARLNIRNIYTFNYDNALEFFLGEEKRQEGEKEIERLEGELINIFNQRDRLEKQKEQLENILPLEASSSDGNAVANKTDESKGRDDLIHEIDKIKEQLSSCRQKEDGVREQIEVLKDKRLSYYNVVKDSFEISLSGKRKNIYKIHGNLRPSNESDYGFDGDTHTQYIITAEDYDSYNDKHNAFVSMMRIDLLRNRFCIMGVSGGDANFLAWIDWVKDVLDKTKARSKGSKGDLHKSYFIYSGKDDIPREMTLMLQNHFIQPVILKEAFPSAKNDEERIRRFLEYVQPLRNEASGMDDLWSGIKNPRRKTPISSDRVEELFNMSARNRFSKPNSLASYISEEVQIDVASYIKEGASEDDRKLYAAAIQSSMIPVDLTCRLEHEVLMMKEKDITIRNVFHSAWCRSGLLLNSKGLNQRLIGNDRYTGILQNLYNFRFPSQQEISGIEGNDGLDIVRRLSLYRLIRQEGVKEECSYCDFRSPQEFVLAADWLKFIEYKDSLLYKQADSVRKENRLMSLYDYGQAYLKAMRRKEEVSAYGNFSPTVHLDKYDYTIINAAVLLNSFVELGICFVGHQVCSETEWLEIVKALKKRYTSALAFYTVVRGSNGKTVKAVAQEMMYDETSRKALPSILRNLITSLVADDTPVYLKARMAQFAMEILPAVEVRSWAHTFLSSVEDILDLVANQTVQPFEFPKSICNFVAKALEYTRAKEVRLRILDRILDIKQFDDRLDDYINNIAISARKGLSVRDFKPLVIKYQQFAKKATTSNSQQGCFVIINLVGLIDKEKQPDILKMLEHRALSDAYLTEGYAFRIKNYPDLVVSFSKKYLKGDDLWHSGIHENSVSIGSGNVRVSRIDKYLSFNNRQVIAVYNNLQSLLGKIESNLYDPRFTKVDRSWMSPENNFREIIVDMRLFMHRQKKLLSKLGGYEQVSQRIEKAYDSCFFGKSIYQLISDDQVYKAIRRLMVDSEIFGLDNYRLEYEQIIGKLISKDSNELGIIFQHIVWMMTSSKDFFNTDDFEKLVAVVLQVYRPYFDESNDGMIAWNLIGCQKEIAEDSLLTMAKIMREWGVDDVFWSRYKRKYQVI